MLIRSFLILLLIPKKHTSTLDCLKTYGHEEIDLKNDKVALIYSNIYYIYGFTSLSPEKSSTIIIPIEERKLKPFKIIVDHTQPYITLVESTFPGKKLAARSFVAENNVQGTSFCDQKIMKSNAVIKVKSTETNATFMLHGCKLYSDKNDEIHVEKSSIIWTEGLLNREPMDYSKLFDSNMAVEKFPLPEFFDGVICECGEIPYFLSNCTDTKILKEYFIESTNTEVILLVVGILILLACVLLCSCLCIENSLLRKMMRGNSE